MMQLETPSDFTIKDLMLGELLCHSGLLSDNMFMQIIASARKKDMTFASALKFLGFFDEAELFFLRRMLNAYLANSDNLDDILRQIRGSFPFERSAYVPAVIGRLA